MNVDYADDRALFPNIPTRAESLLYNLEQAAGDFGFHVNAEKKNGVHVVLIKKEIPLL